jgi:ABC-type antimicrobial peptide transport system permease subunit
MIFKNLLRRKARSGLTILGIAVGVAAVVTMGALAQGFLTGYGGFMEHSGADLLVTQADAVDITLSVVDEQVGQRIAALPLVRSVSGVIFGITTMEKLPYFVLLGYDPDAVAIRHYKIVEGKPLSYSREIIIGVQAAKNLKKRVGDTVHIFGAAYHIVGIFETGMAFEENGGVITLKDAQAVFKKPRQVNMYQVQAVSPDKIEEAQSRIKRLFPDVTVALAGDFAEQQEYVQMINGFAWGISFIAILVGGLGMMNTMTMAVFERTREIGVLRALGWPRRRVLGMILGESLLLSIIGGVAGIALGVGLSEGLSATPAVSGLVQGEYTPTLFVQAMLVALLLGAVGGAYPAWRGASLSPVEALHYEGREGGNLPGSLARLGGMAFRNLWRRRTRSILTIAGIGVGVAVIVALGAMTAGMIQQFTEINARGGADLAAMQANAADMSYSAIDERIGQAIAAMPSVRWVDGLVFGVVSSEDMPFFIVWGVDPAGESVRHYRITSGRRIQTRGEIMLGKVAADNLKKKVGDRLRLYRNSYSVVGIYETGLGYEEGAGVIALRDAQAVFRKPRQVGFYQIKLQDPAQVEQVKRQIQERFPEIRVSTVADFVESTNDIKNWQAISGAIFALAVLVGGIGITNTMVMAVMERTREVGTLRALGWQKSRILKMILQESVLLSLVSGLAGIGLGIGLSEAITLEPTMGSLLRGTYSLPLFAQALAVAFVLGVIGGIYPAWQASGFSPAEALRYE